MDRQNPPIPCSLRKRPSFIVAEHLKPSTIHGYETKESFFGDWAFDKLDWKSPTTKRINTSAKLQFKKTMSYANNMMQIPASASIKDTTHSGSNKRIMDEATLASVSPSKNSQQKYHEPINKRLELERDQGYTEISSTFTCLTFVAVKADPCVLLPVEVWHLILSYLSPSQMAKASLVSTSWLEYTRSHPIWKTICEIGDLGVPKRKYKSFMAIACANSYWTCEFCFSHTRGRPSNSSIPLPVPIDELGGEFRSICAECRIEYYATHDQKPYIMNGIRVDGSRRWTIRMGEKANWSSCGGSVGLVASDRKIAATRHLRFSARSKNTWDSRPNKKARRED